MKYLILQISIFLFLIGTVQIANAQCGNDDANPQLSGMSFATACTPEATTTTMSLNWSMISADGVATAPAGSWQILISFDALARYTYNVGSVDGPGFSWAWDEANKSLRGTTNVDMTYDISDISNLQIPQGTVEVTVTGVTSTSCIAVLSNANVVIVPAFLGGCTQAFQNQISDDAVQSSLGIDVVPVPVELIDFNARPNQNVNDLTWSTATEDNTDSFIIERSTDGFKTYEVVGEESAVGFSSSIQNYLFTDRTPAPTSYYRLKIMDFDGSFEYSHIEVVERKGGQLGVVSVMPNPTRRSVKVVLNTDSQQDDYELTLVDVYRSTLYQEMHSSENGTSSVILDLNNYPDGIYFLRARQGKEVYVERIVKTSAK